MEFGFHILGCEHLHIMHQCYLCVKHLPKKKKATSGMQIDAFLCISRKS